MMVAISHGMYRSFCYENRFSTFLLSFIKRTKHTVRHKTVFVAMNKQHRFGAPSNLLYLTRLVKRPTVFLFTQP